MNIRAIDASETLEIRHKVMWPNQPREYVQLPNDREGKHLGLFLDQKLISVVSLFTANQQVQFRKFATLEAYQGKGYGSQLLRQAIDLAKEAGNQKIWCNARVHKRAFYHKFGLKETNQTFLKGGIEYVIMEMEF